MAHSESATLDHESHDQNGSDSVEVQHILELSKNAGCGFGITTCKLLDAEVPEHCYTLATCLPIIHVFLSQVFKARSALFLPIRTFHRV